MTVKVAAAWMVVIAIGGTTAAVAVIGCITFIVTAWTHIWPLLAIAAGLAAFWWALTVIAPHEHDDNELDDALVEETTS